MAQKEPPFNFPHSILNYQIYRIHERENRIFIEPLFH